MWRGDGEAAAAAAADKFQVGFRVIPFGVVGLFIPGTGYWKREGSRAGLGVMELSTDSTVELGSGGWGWIRDPAAAAGFGRAAVFDAEELNFAAMAMASLLALWAATRSSKA